jgi:hypothetical protein
VQFLYFLQFLHSFYLCKMAPPLGERITLIETKVSELHAHLAKLDSLTTWLETVKQHQLALAPAVDAQTESLSPSEVKPASNDNDTVTPEVAVVDTLPPVALTDGEMDVPNSGVDESASTLPSIEIVDVVVEAPADAIVTESSAVSSSTDPEPDHPSTTNDVVPLVTPLEPTPSDVPATTHESDAAPTALASLVSEIENIAKMVQLHRLFMETYIKSDDEAHNNHLIRMTYELISALEYKLVNFIH